MRIATATRWQIPSVTPVPDRTRTAPVQMVRRELGDKPRSSGSRTYSSETCSFSSVGRECSSEHGPLAYRLFFRHFILNDVPMLDKDSVLNAHNICAIQFTGAPKPLNRPCTITRSPSATIVPSYLNVGGRLWMRLNRPSRPGRYERV